MKASFNLVTEPWIPCVTAAGKSVELGLLDTLVRAHELREVVDPSPLVTASLHRLLLAILHRNFGPRNYDAWKELWSAGRFDAPVLTDYFDQWRHRFDLFDEERPFYQTPGMPEAMLKPVSALAHETASGNNPTLFDHSCEDQPSAVRPAEVARLLVALQASALHGTVSRERPQWVSAKAGPTARGMLVMPMGDTLSEILMLSAIPQTQWPFPPSPADVPAWEHGQPASVVTRAPLGYLDYLTWQSRRVWLRAEAVGGSTLVRQAISAKGCEFHEGTQPQDPMMAYVAPKDLSREPAALELDEDRALWRDSMVLLSSAQDRWHRPQTVEHLAQLVPDPLPDSAICDLCIFGMALTGRQKRNVAFWRHERQPLPLRYLCDEPLVEHVTICLENTEAAHNALRDAAYVLAKHILTMGTREPDSGDVGDLIDSLGVSAHYWAALEPRFRALVIDLAAAPWEARDRLEAQWASGVASAARDAFGLAERAVAPNARNLRAIAEARRSLAIGLRKVTRQYEEVKAAHAD